MLRNDTLTVRSATIGEEEYIALMAEMRLSEKLHKRQIIISRTILYGLAVLNLLFGIHGLLSDGFSKRSVVFLLCALIGFILGGRAKIEVRASLKHSIRRRMRNNPKDVGQYQNGSAVSEYIFTENGVDVQSAVNRHYNWDSILRRTDFDHYVYLWMDEGSILIDKDDLTDSEERFLDDLLCRKLSTEEN